MMMTMIAVILLFCTDTESFCIGGKFLVRLITLGQIKYSIQILLSSIKQMKTGRRTTGKVSLGKTQPGPPGKEKLVPGGEKVRRGSVPFSKGLKKEAASDSPAASFFSGRIAQPRKAGKRGPSPCGHHTPAQPSPGPCS